MFVYTCQLENWIYEIFSTQVVSKTSVKNKSFWQENSAQQYSNTKMSEIMVYQIEYDVYVDIL